MTPFATMFLHTAAARPAPAVADAFAGTVARHGATRPVGFAEMFLQARDAAPSVVVAAFARTAGTPAPRRAMRSPLRSPARRGIGRAAARRAA